MLPKQNRLTTRFEFNVTRKHGTYFNAGLFHAYYLTPTNYEGPPKIGFVVSNKFHKSAVKRNRIKRLFRESFRHKVANIKDNLWVVIHPKVACLEKTYEEIDSDVAKFLQSAPVIR